ncbi:MAG: hypothetical protein ACOYO1_06815 [Bacteroidales bacterium]
MNSAYLTFVKRLFIFTIIISSISMTAFFLLPKNLTTPALPFLLPFFFSITLISHYLQLKATKKSFARFTSGFMLITFLKLMVLMTVLLLYVLFNRSDAVPFIIWYFVFYVCFTAFEVIALQRISENKE